jgi:hypothetical protein
VENPIYDVENPISDVENPISNVENPILARHQPRRYAILVSLMYLMYLNVFECIPLYREKNLAVVKKSCHEDRGEAPSPQPHQSSRSRAVATFPNRCGKDRHFKTLVATLPPPPYGRWQGQNHVVQGNLAHALGGDRYIAINAPSLNQNKLAGLL